MCDKISDALLDAYLEKDPNSRCGIETMGGKGKIFITGEVTSKAKVNIKKIVKGVLIDSGYDTNYEIVDNIGKQSPDIAQGVDVGGAGDQGMMFGYACRGKNYLPTAMVILQELSQRYSNLIKTDKRFLPDGKAQITGCYDSQTKKLIYIKDFVVSYQNTEEERESTDEIIKVMCESICSAYKISVHNFHINPTGKFLIGGFEGDAGLTGRKIVVDNYQSFANVGGGAFSGKDPTKVDRSAAYKARQLAIECLDTFPDIEWCEIQISYAIGMDKPLAIYAKTNRGTISTLDRFYEECTPSRIIKDLHLNDGTVKFGDTAKFGHFGHSDFPWESR